MKVVEKHTYTIEPKNPSGLDITSSFLFGAP